MLKQSSLSVFWDDNGSFTNHSLAAQNYDRDTLSLASLSATQDYLYLGLYKKFHSVYVEMSTPNDAAKTFTVQYYNGSTWASVTNLTDDTKGFSRSGFLRFDPNPTDWAATTINSTEKYWVRLRPDGNFDADCAAQGINIVYSDDNELTAEVPGLLNQLASGENSFILRHQASRDDIVQHIRNKGKFKERYSDGNTYQIDAWDFLDIEEIKNWSKYLTLSKIFENLSTREDDVYWIKSKRFLDKANEASNLYYATLDLDDDGNLDIEERLGTFLKSSTLVRR